MNSTASAPSVSYRGTWNTRRARQSHDDVDRHQKARRRAAGTADATHTHRDTAVGVARLLSNDPLVAVLGEQADESHLDTNAATRR
jgi:hypothetical protein